MKSERRDFVKRLIPWFDSLTEEDKKNYFLTKEGKLVKIRGKGISKKEASHDEILGWINKTK